MFKKLMLLLGLIILVTLTACNQEEEPIPIAEPEPEPVVEEPEPFEFSIEMISNGELAALGEYVEVDYASARELDMTEGLNLQFDFNHPVTDFSFISVQFLGEDSEIYEEGLTFAKTGVLSEVGDLDPKVPLILTNYFGMGTLAASGFTFIDPDGERVWYTFQQSAKDGGMEWQPFNWSDERDIYEPYIWAGEPSDLDGGTEQPEEPPAETPPTVAIPAIRVEWLRETLHDVVEFNYSESRGTAVEGAETLLIAPATTLREFSFIDIDHETADGGPQAIDVIFLVGDLAPEQPLLIHSFFGHETLPRSGFMFTDETGTRRFFTILPDQSDAGGFIVNEFTQEDFTFWGYSP